jgi:hypothetical protein
LETQDALQYSNDTRGKFPLLWLLIEAGIALAILIGIVWWTLPGRRDRPDGEGKPRDDDRRP